MIHNKNVISPDIDNSEIFKNKILPIFDKVFFYLQNFKQMFEKTRKIVKYQNFTYFFF